MIKVESISKRFKLYRSPADRLKEIILRKKYHTEFQALNNVSFEVANGEVLGIVGPNGAGKSTLLKILTGVLLQNSGSLHINGKITGLLELGTGFNFEMTGLENIYMNGTLIGMTKDEIDKKRQDIIDFTELGEFIFEPIKTYSSGMVMRLAFSIAIHAEPKCFVVDEALSVGDAHFQQKCMTKIKEFRQNGGSIIFVSHDINAIKMLCDNAILLNHGVVIETGTPEKVVNSYNFLLSKLNDQENKVTLLNKEEHSYGSFEAEILNVSITGEESKSNVISSGENAAIIVEIKAHRDIEDVTVGILIRDRYGQDIFGTNTYYHNLKLNMEKGKAYKYLFKTRMDIGTGKYTLTAAIHKKHCHTESCFHWVDNAAAFEVAGNYGNSFVGLSRLYPVIEVQASAT